MKLKKILVWMLVIVGILFILLVIFGGDGNNDKPQIVLKDGFVI